ncbi:hypothetical protein [Mesorhizobium sophorae]|uniref:hypothetical protein n=1 Tax=Mesorhizobium sophorae TaxID=1300294 RepID=UPI000BA4D592|nr:hypothetical protein [Mesorhizobium sophorae]
MPQLNLTITLDAPDGEIDAVADTLGCAPGHVEQRLEPYAQAALREYIEMFAGEAMTTVSDLRERRLVAILLALPAADFPTDEKIARMFNLSGAQGRALLRATLSRHRNQLKGVMHAAARRFIAACQGAQGGDREARLANAVVIEMLNGELASAAVPRTPIRRKVGTFDTYVVSNGTFIELQALYPQ